MKYTTPIYDRTFLDVKNRTSKGYFNFVDWLRVYSNAELLRALEIVIYNEGLAYVNVNAPDKNVIPTATEINGILINIELIRDFIDATGTVTLKTDWGGVDSPKYNHVNDWERNMDLLLAQMIEGYTDWVSDSVTPVRRARTDVAICGAGLTRNNGFRRYD